MPQRIETVTVNGSPMEVFLFEPSGPGPHPGLVLCQHIPFGHAGLENDEFTLKTAERYAQSGYFVAAPFIFHWWPKSDDIQKKGTQSRDDWTILDLQAAYALLAGQPGVDADRIGIAGHCWGGRVAWLGAATNPAYRACAIFYGGRIRLRMGPPGSAAAIERAADIRCPVIGFFGNEDKNPPPEDVDAYEAALQKAGVEHVFHRYPAVGHGFQAFNAPDRYRPAASEDAWTKVLAFLAEKLAPRR